MDYIELRGEEEAECFVATLRQAGIRSHAQMEMGDGWIADIYDTDHLHAILVKTELVNLGKKRILLKISGRRDDSN